MELLKREMDEERERQLKQCREVRTCVLTVCVGVCSVGFHTSLRFRNLLSNVAASTRPMPTR